MNRSFFSKISLSLLAALILASCSSTSTDGVSTQTGNLSAASQSFSLPADNEFGMKEDLSLTTAQLLSIRTYHFAFDRYDLVGVNMQAVRAQGVYLSSHPNMTVLLSGNTDIRGSREYNIGLGWRRAQAVANVLLQQGAKRDQIHMVSYGAEKPVAMGNTEHDYAMNRRVDLVYCEDRSCSAVYGKDGLKSDF